MSLCARTYRPGRLRMASLLVALCTTALAFGQTGSGCADPTACNFDEAAPSPINSVLCDYCGCPEVQVPTTAFFPSDSAGYGLRVNLVETHGPTTTGLEDLFGMRTFRVYAVAENPSAIVSAVSGSSVDGPLVCSAPEGYYQHPLGSLTGGGILSPLFAAGFPALQYDSWVTIGIDQESSALGDNFSSISTIAAPGEDWISTFEPGLGAPGSSFEATNSVGGGWFCIPTSDNCIPDSTGAVLLGQFTSGGDVSGSLTVQFQPLGAGQGDLNLNIAFGSSGLGIPTWTQPEDCPCASDTDSDGICAPFDACSDLSACNYSDPLNPPCAYLDACGTCGGLGIPSGACDCQGTLPDAVGVCGGSCPADLDSDGVCDDVDDCIGDLDACGICNGPGAVFSCGCDCIPVGDCDCEGNQLDALGECGGNCTSDADGDGVCDDVDDCVGTLDACGVCNGPGEIYDCGCTGIPAGDCDCDGNQLDALGECGGSCPADTDGDGVCDDAEVDGCTNPFACNYNAAATDDDGSCLTEDAIGVCGGDCPADADGDGICDNETECVGTVDACGVCNGPGAIFDCGCSGTPIGDCDCNGNQLDAVGVCGGTCTADADGDGVCDDVDDCVGSFDACGVCNGPGEIYDCGCTGIPNGDCDCDGNQLDALGECGGTCPADTDGDGVCDDAEVDGCTNPFACNYSVVATDDDGSCLTEDAIGVCGGDCPADADGDGICDDVDDCVGSLDACGACNGPGEIYDCGCSGIPDGDCDCDGNQPDALGECGG
ncbi:hypothetical protein OAO65_03180, partial [Flavobacteriales bacterium]|nr:hypothetical protein [Flavobacteriales bacterium]